MRKDRRGDLSYAEEGSTKSYDVIINTGGNTPEEVLYGVPAAAEIRGLDEEIEPYPANTSEHLPVLESAQEVLLDNGYDTDFVIDHQEVRGDTAAEALRNLVETGIPLKAILRGPKVEINQPGSNLPRSSSPADFLFPDLEYDAESKGFEPHIGKSISPQQEEEKALIETRIEEIDTEVREILDGEGLLK